MIHVAFTRPVTAPGMHPRMRACLRINTRIWLFGVWTEHALYRARPAYLRYKRYTYQQR